MRFEKFTQKLQAAIQEAQSLALGRDHTGIDPVHLLAALLQDESNLSICQQAGASIPALKMAWRKLWKTKQSLANQPATLI